MTRGIPSFRLWGVRLKQSAPEPRSSGALRLVDEAHAETLSFPRTCSPCTGLAQRGTRRARLAPQSEEITSRISRAVSLGVLPTRTPTASKACFLASAVPEEPEMMAPACPMVLPTGAVKPAM